MCSVLYSIHTGGNFLSVFSKTSIRQKMWREIQIFTLFWEPACFTCFVYCLMKQAEPSYQVTETLVYSAFRVKVLKILTNNRSDCCDNENRIHFWQLCFLCLLLDYKDKNVQFCVLAWCFCFCSYYLYFPLPAQCGLHT